MDASLWVLYYLLGIVNEDLEGVIDVQSKISTQIKAYRQTAVAMDDTYIVDNIGIHGIMDV